MSFRTFDQELRAQKEHRAAQVAAGLEPDPITLTRDGDDDTPVEQATAEPGEKRSTRRK